MDMKPGSNPCLLATTDRVVYAKNVCMQSLSNCPPAWYWSGKTTGLVRFLDTFAWRGIWVILSGLRL